MKIKKKKTKARLSVTTTTTKDNFVQPRFDGRTPNGGIPPPPLYSPSTESRHDKLHRIGARTSSSSMLMTTTTPPPPLYSPPKHLLRHQSELGKALFNDAHA